MKIKSGGAKEWFEREGKVGGVGGGCRRLVDVDCVFFFFFKQKTAYEIGQ